MSPVAPRRPGAASMFTPTTLAAAAGAAVIVLFAVLIVSGTVDLGLFGPAPPSTEGLVPVPTPIRTVPAYTRIRREHLWDPVNRRFSVVYLPPRAVTPEMLTNITQILGRVLEQEKEAGYVFTDIDFLPPGTREGVVAGIPAGKRALRVSGERVEGLQGLLPGDRFDLLASMPIETGGEGGEAQPFAFSGPYSTQLALQAQLSNWTKQATVRVLVQNAVVVEPMTARAIPLGPGQTEGTTRVRPVQEAVIAVNPDEVALLTEAMTVPSRITTVPRSGRPDDPRDSVTPDLRPFAPFTAPGRTAGGERTDRDAFTVVETINGQARTLAAVPRP